jgi:hypothetical protein
MKVRAAEPRDSHQYPDWLQNTPGNLYDPKVYEYPTCTTLVAEDSRGPALTNSFQEILTIEALAPRPGLSPMQEAKALSKLFDAWRKIAQELGIREI